MYRDTLMGAVLVAIGALVSVLQAIAGDAAAPIALSAASAATVCSTSRRDRSSLESDIAGSPCSGPSPDGRLVARRA